MTPDEFWAITPDEYNRLRDGFYRRRRKDLERQARWICVLINHFPMRGKNAKTIRVEHLIGYSDDELKAIERKREEAIRHARQEGT